MISFFTRWASGMYYKRVDAMGLAIFRIAFFLNFFMEVLQLFEFRHLIYDTVPLIQPADIDPSYILVFWLLIIGCLVVGAFTRLAAIISYILTMHFMGLTLLYEYHMFHVYLIVNFLVIFLPVSQVISLDAIWNRLKYSSTRDEYLHRGFRDFTAYWIGKTHHSFKDARFRIWVKYMDTPLVWEYNFLRNQLAKPWHDAGTARWLDKQFSMDIVNIEEIR